MNSDLMLLCSVCRGLTQHTNQCEVRATNNRTIGLFACYRCRRVQVLDAPADHPGGTDFVVYPGPAVNREGIPDEVMHSLDEALIAFVGGAFQLAVNGVRTALQLAMRQQGAEQRVGQ